MIGFKARRSDGWQTAEAPQVTEKDIALQSKLRHGKKSGRERCARAKSMGFDSAIMRACRNSALMLPINIHNHTTPASFAHSA